MQVTLLGKQIVSYTKKQTGEFKEGISIFYMGPKDGVEGMAADSLWVDIKSQLYNAAKAMDLSKPVRANVVNEVPIGGRFPKLTEIELLKQ